MKTNADQRNIVVPVRMTKAEVEAVQRKAEKEGISRSEWLRGRALSGDDFISNKKRQEYFRGQIMVAMEYQIVKQTIRKQGYQINLDDLERSIYQLCL